MSHPQGSTWRAAGRLSHYRFALFLIEFVRLAAWSGSLLLIGWLLHHVFDALSGEAPAGIDVYALIAILAAAELARLGLMWAGTVGDTCWQYLRGLLQLNLLRAQMHSGGPDAGAPPQSPGEALTRFRDDVDDFLLFLDTVTNAASKVVLTVGAMVVMVSIEPVLALAVALPLLAVVLVTRLASRRIRTTRAEYRHATAAVTSRLGELFSGVLAVKSAGAGRGVINELAALNERRREAGLRDQLVSQLLSRFNRASVDLSTGVVLLLAVPAMRRGDFTVGDLALFVSYISSLVWVPYYAGQVLARHRQAEVSVGRMTTLLPPAKPEALTAHRPLDGTEPLAPAPIGAGAGAGLGRLTVCGLTAVHPSSGRGVHEVSLTVERGTFTVVTGPAGAGKTTLLRAILGLLPASSGTVYWNDVPVDDRAAMLVPPRSAYVPQVPQLFSEPLRDNLLLGRHRDDRVLASALRTAVLDRDVELMPAALDTEVGARGVRLSGGQAQRTAIARALAHPADLVVLDEVTSALDVETERLMWDRLLAEDRTLLAVSSRPATIARADTVITLHEGRIRHDSNRNLLPTNTGGNPCRTLR